MVFSSSVKGIGVNAWRECVAWLHWRKSMAYGPLRTWFECLPLTPRGLVEKSGPSLGLWALWKAFFAITSNALSLFFPGCALVGHSGWHPTRFLEKKIIFRTHGIITNIMQHVLHSYFTQAHAWDRVPIGHQSTVKPGFGNTNLPFPFVYLIVDFQSYV